MWNVDLTTRPDAEHLYVLFVLGEKELSLVIKLPRRLDIDSEDSSDCPWLNKVVHRSLLSPMAIPLPCPRLGTTDRQCRYSAALVCCLANASQAKPDLLLGVIDGV